MGLTKSEKFTANQNTIANMARAVAHPARIAILQKLMAINACAGTEIVDEIPLAQPTISRHLRVLKDAGLIRGTISGNQVNYCIDPIGWQSARHMFTVLFSGEPADNLECC